jgi:hypothetical protein
MQGQYEYETGEGHDGANNVENVRQKTFRYRSATAHNTPHYNALSFEKNYSHRSMLLLTSWAAASAANESLVAASATSFESSQNGCVVRRHVSRHHASVKKKWNSTSC